MPAWCHGRSATRRSQVASALPVNDREHLRSRHDACGGSRRRSPAHVLAHRRRYSMFRMLRPFAWAILIASLPLTDALAHCFVGARFFPATITVDDPCVADELSLPTVSSFKNEDVPAARQLDISGEFSKRITDAFGVSVESTWTRIRPPGRAHCQWVSELGDHGKVPVPHRRRT